MTVAELIEKLKDMPQDIRVVISGFKSDYEDIEHLGQVRLNLNVNTGHHESARFNERGSSVDAVGIS